MCSTVFGIMLFMFEILLIVWLQFYTVSIQAAYVATAVLVPIFFFFLVIIFNFYKKLSKMRVKALAETLYDGIQRDPELGIGDQNNVSDSPTANSRTQVI